MAALSPSTLLRMWERGVYEVPVARPLSALAEAHPEQDPDELGRLSVGRCDGELLSLREETFGSRVDAVVDCASCGELLELSLDTAALARGSPGAAGVHSVSCEAGEVRFRLPTRGDLAAMANGDGLTAVGEALLERCVVSPPPKELSAGARRAVIERMAELDRLAALELALACPACGAAGRAIFDIGAFVCAELEAAALATLEEVHVLASAYGWREADVLELSPARRRLYLELVG
jgi:hypothetical protein